MKTMGFSDLVLVKPGRLAVPGHEMAFKMAVACVGRAQRRQARPRREQRRRRVVAGLRDYLAPRRLWRSTARDAARAIVERASRGERTAILFGNEKTGLSEEDRAPASASLRIPMAADQPSINLAQAVQIVAYELMIAALEARTQGAT